MGGGARPRQPSPPRPDNGRGGENCLRGAEFRAGVFSFSSSQEFWGGCREGGPPRHAKQHVEARRPPSAARARRVSWFDGWSTMPCAAPLHGPLPASGGREQERRAGFAALRGLRARRQLWEPPPSRGGIAGEASRTRGSRRAVEKLPPIPCGERAGGGRPPRHATKPIEPREQFSLSRSRGRDRGRGRRGIVDRASSHPEPQFPLRSERYRRVS